MRCRWSRYVLGSQSSDPNSRRAQHAILTGWFRIAESDRLQLRSFLLEMLSTRHASLERYVMNKLCKTIVDIGKFEWPMNFPDLLPFTQQLIQRPDTSALGLILLGTLVEEFSSSREDIPAARKIELKKVRLSVKFFAVCCSHRPLGACRAASWCPVACPGRSRHHL